MVFVVVITRTICVILIHRLENDYIAHFRSEELMANMIGTIVQLLGMLVVTTVWPQHLVFSVRVKREIGLKAFANSQLFPMLKFQHFYCGSFDPTKIFDFISTTNKKILDNENQFLIFSFLVAIERLLYCNTKNSAINKQKH